MTRMQKAAVLTELSKHLLAKGSWAGETHVQKAAFFLQTLLGVPLGFDFVLYKHGPFSFDLSDELSALQADYLLKMRVRKPGYGPSLLPTETSAELRKRYPNTLEKSRSAIEFVAKTFMGKGVADLERLSTALLVTQGMGGDTSVEDRAKRINELKAHVSLDEAASAVREVDRVIKKATAFKYS